MVNWKFFPATEGDIAFIRKTYDENIESLHGNHRTNEDWKKLLEDPSSQYYIVSREAPVAWFRLDPEGEQLWIGMLQVRPIYHRQGVGKYILSAVENLARDTGVKAVGIHTTEDNSAARSLYESAGYEVTEIGPCTTADGIDRVGYTYKKTI